MNEELLRAVLAEFFDERARVGAATHGQHHEWIAARIEAERARREMYRKIAEAVISWSVPALLGGVLYWITRGAWGK